MNEATNSSAAGRHRAPSFGDAFRFWLKLGFISFGGPTGQIAIMQTELVEKKKWISQSRFLHALNLCMLLPGPEAIQLAIYIGWLLHKIRGGIVAGALFVVPSIFVLWTLSFIYAAFGNLPWIAAIFYGLKPAVTAVVLVAVIRIGRKALKNGVMWSLAVVAFVAIYFLKVPFPAIVLGAGVIGFFGGVFWKSKFETSSSHDADTTLSVISDEQESPPHTLPNFRRAILISFVCLVLWLAPTIAAGALHGWDSTLFKEGFFFSKAAVVTFGGAYALLSLDFCRRPAHRAVARKSETDECALGRDRGNCWRDFESSGLVRNPRFPSKHWRYRLVCDSSLLRRFCRNAALQDRYHPGRAQCRTAGTDL